MHKRFPGFFAMALVAAVGVYASGCASIVSSSKWPVTVTSNPPGVRVTIENNKGETIHEGTTPLAVTLSSKGGYFRAAEYTFHYVYGGNAVDLPVKAELNNWYLGNIVSFGVIGMVIVDPLTGAMYRISDKPFCATFNNGGHAQPADPAAPQAPGAPLQNPVASPSPAEEQVY